MEISMNVGNGRVSGSLYVKILGVNSKIQNGDS